MNAQQTLVVSEVRRHVLRAREGAQSALRLFITLCFIMVLILCIMYHSKEIVFVVVVIGVCLVLWMVCFSVG